MSTTRLPAPIDLPRDAIRRFIGPLRVQCERGTLWITVDGAPEDIVLEAGAARSFAAADRVLVYALGGAATLRTRPGARVRDGAAPRWRQWLQRLLAPAATGAQA